MSFNAMLDASELSDNISINSDDTDILLSKSHSVTVNDYQLRIDESPDGYVPQNEYLNQDVLDIWQSDVLSPKQSNSNRSSYGLMTSYRVQDIDVNTTDSYKNYPPKKVSFERSPNNTHSSSNFEDDIILDEHKVNSSYNHHEFEEIDAKVKEGQEILKRLLSGSDDGQYKSVSHKSPREKLEISSSSYAESNVPHDSSLVARLNFDATYNKTTDLTSSEDDAKDILEDVELNLSNTLNQETLSDLERNHSSEHMMKQIDSLQEELSNTNKIKEEELQSFQQEHDEEVMSLQECISILQEQKFSLTDHVAQLKESLAKKNAKCVELQDNLQEKIKQIHSLTSKGSQERQNLQHQVHTLQSREKILEQQVNNVEQAFNKQFNQIKEIEDRFRKEKQLKVELIEEKEHEIISLNELIKKNTNMAKLSEEKKQQEFEQKLMESVQQERALLQSEINSMKECITNVQRQKIKIRKQQTLESDRFKINMEALKAINLKLKQDLESCRKEVQKLRGELSSSSIVTHTIKDNVEHKSLKEKLSQNEKLLTTIAVDLIEENTKLTVITGKSNLAKSLSPGRNSSNIVTDAMDLLKENVENVRHIIASLQQQNGSHQQQREEQQVTNETSDSVESSPTSARLLRHLQTRVQLLRKENMQLKENSFNKSDQDIPLNNSSEMLKLENRVQELEISLQRYELDSQRSSHLLQQRTMELTKLQKVLTQATKENMKLERMHAKLQKSVEEHTVNGDVSPQRRYDDQYSVKQLQSKSTSTRPFTNIHQSHNTTHKKALGPDYPGTNIKKFPVPTTYIAWHVSFSTYTPVEYTSSRVLSRPVWADPEVSLPEELLKFNRLDGKIDRRSFTGKYDVINGVPRNPIGRTGMSGRGLLGRWGPNHAADPIVTRWLRDSEGCIIMKNGKHILEFIAIQRKDTNEWAIPGGMVDAGEAVSATLRREFSEEALNSLDSQLTNEVKMKIDDLFQNGTTIHKGYVDDPRNTDNAWMETIAVNYHDNNGQGVAKLPLRYGDDAKGVEWVKIDKKLVLYASHVDFIKRTCDFHEAFYSE